MTTTPLFDYAATPTNERQQLERIFGSFTMLTHVLDWGRQEQPPFNVDEIITQDEYTHDALMPFTNGRYLNFDTT